MRHGNDVLWGPLRYDRRRLFEGYTTFEGPQFSSMGEVTGYPTIEDILTFFLPQGSVEEGVIPVGKPRIADDVVRGIYPYKLINSRADIALLTCSRTITDYTA